MTSSPGPRNLITDVEGVLVGSAHDEIVKTGVTVIRPRERAVCAVMVSGGGPGTRETDALAPDTLVDSIDALVFSGGSVYGLAAADSVAAVLGAGGQGYSLRPAAGVPVTPIVPAAILYDLANGGDKAWGEDPPYGRLARKALAAAGEDFSLGKAGAGFGAMAGRERGGLGSASLVLSDGVRVGALAAVNAFGSVRMPGADVFWAWPYEQAGEFGGARPPQDYRLDLEDWGLAKTRGAAGRMNTTLACVAVSADLSASECRRVAQMASAGLARAIRPVFAPFDGDVVFCLATGAASLPEERALAIARLGEAAAACLARAVARGVHEASGGPLHAGASEATPAHR